MKKATFTVNDDNLIEGAKEEARNMGKSFSHYIQELLEKDLQEKLQHKIVAYYEDGSTHTERHFYTDTDLIESMTAYYSLIGVECAGSVLKGFRAYKRGKLVIERGEVPQEEEV